MKITFVGDPKSRQPNDPEHITLHGMRFPRGVAVDISEEEPWWKTFGASVLANNHFEVDGVRGGKSEKTVVPPAEVEVDETTQTENLGGSTSTVSEPAPADDQTDAPQAEESEDGENAR